MKPTNIRRPTHTLELLGVLWNHGKPACKLTVIRQCSTSSLRNIYNNLPQIAANRESFLDLEEPYITASAFQLVNLLDVIL